MIHYVGTRHTLNAVRWFLATLPADVRPALRPIGYAALFRRRHVPAGTWIFADLERLGPRDQERAAAIWNALDAARRAGAPVRLLNHPIASMRRYELLRTLHDRGLNAFDVFRLDEGRQPKRYPVFLRGERDHEGSRSELLDSPEALEAAVEQRRRTGRALDGLVAVEYCGARDAAGRHRKYAAFRIGDAVVPRHLYASDDWVVKTPDLAHADLAQEELAFLRDNPHAEALDAVFRLARIDYGRVDYGVVDGRVQVYEINTAPILDGVIDESRRRAVEAGNPLLLAALAEVDCGGPAPAATIPLPRERRRPSAYAMRRAFQDVLRRLGLLRFEPRISLAIRDRRRRGERRTPGDAPGGTRRR